MMFINTDISGNDLLSLQLHPLQSLAPSERRTAALRRVLTSVTCAVGIDINKAVVRGHLAAPLSFVCGLGPRKADDLLRKLRSEGALLTNRQQLLAKNHIGPVVFQNVVGFLRLPWTERDEEELLKHEHELDQSSSSSSSSRRRKQSDASSSSAVAASSESRRTFLDATRIHPNVFGYAFRVVIDALEYLAYQEQEQEQLNPRDPKVALTVELLISQLRQPGKLGEV
jgi:transcriptional accessory protein Tex/SPT6